MLEHFLEKLSPKMQLGQLLCDRYQLRQLLGRALGRQTWLAVDLSMQPAKAVVVKLLAFGELVQWDDLKLFEREAQVLQQLQHPHIPRYVDAFTLGKTPYWFGLVQDYVPGFSLQQLLASGKHFQEIQVRQIAVNILHLLIYLHQLSPPVLHRDIKPSNLIWGEDNFIYLIDFGAVQDRAFKEGASFTVVGTYGYAPMEQFGGRAVPASDLYGLGATLIHLLTGIAPADLPQKGLRIQFRDRVSLDPTFLNWIEKLVEPDVADRFQSTQEALNALCFPSYLTPTQHPALSANHARSLHPPQDTQVILQQSNQELLITIPGYSARLWLALMPMGTGFFIFFSIPLLAFAYTFFSEPLILVLFLICFLVPFIGILHGFYSLCLPTFVQFKENEFFIYKHMFNKLHVLEHGLINDIEDVVVNTSSNGKTYPRYGIVVIQSTDSERSFRVWLSREECRWLVDVIRSWLNQ